MNYVVFDLEATCWDKGINHQNEIIEIGALLINEQQVIVSEFQRFVKPLRHPKLSDFCTELTSITQADVDEAAHFYEVVEAFKNWFGADHQEYYLCSWGFYDKKQLISDCALSQLDDQWVHRHISVKHQYQKVKNLRRAIGMSRALELENLTLEGTHHRGIDDARNIAKIFLKYFADWRFDR